MSESERRATEQDVINCYHLFLGREPESQEVIQDHLNLEGPSLWKIIRRIYNCPEALTRSKSYFADVVTTRAEFTNSIEIDLPPGRLDDLLKHVRQVWSKFGEEDPHWSVLTHNNFRRETMNAASERAFFSSGRDYCDQFAAACHRNGLSLPIEGVVLDFGCGVGRIGEHLSHDFANYVGVDISLPHLELAKKRMQQLGRTNCKFQLLTDFLDAKSHFDAFISIIVLQHNPPPVMNLLLNNLLKRLAPGGVGYFQVPCVLFGYNFKLDNYLSNFEKNDQMEMHALPQRTVFKALVQNNCRLIEMISDGFVGRDGLSYTFLVEKQ
jgi:SAM-dependent methyltransferase